MTRTWSAHVTRDCAAGVRFSRSSHRCARARHASNTNSAQPASEIPPPPASEVRFKPPTQKGREDAALVRAVLAGDERAFRAIWNKYVALVRSKLGHVRRDIDDCVQEVFVRLHGRLPYLRDHTALSSFHHRHHIARRRHELRRRKSASWIMLTPTGDLPEPMMAPKEGDAREAFARSRPSSASSARALGRVFELRYMEHKELVDVAAAMTSRSRRPSATWPASRRA